MKCGINPYSNSVHVHACELPLPPSPYYKSDNIIDVLIKQLCYLTLQVKSHQLSPCDLQILTVIMYGNTPFPHHCNSGNYNHNPDTAVCYNNINPYGDYDL